jgi:16S rRNA (adenine1518-N6/adenine1519-N6)-dimethyltransferase
MGRPKRRRLGQSFLVDRRIAERIVGQLDDDPPRVLEIGPGRGALTAPLLDRFDRVMAVELDPSLAPELEDRFARSGLELKVADALADPLDELAGGERPWQVASNLPYSVGTAILRRLLPRHDLFSKAVVMLQREVARRVVVEPGDRGHGLLALERAAHADARVVFDVGPRAFRPRPKVVSSVVVLELRPARFDPAALDGGLRLAAHALTKPRKKLANAIQPLCTEEALTAADLDPAARPGTIALEGWISLAKVIS